MRYSRQVAGEVEFFISYCQKGSPRQSHIALLQYVNGRAAVIFSFVVAIVVLILQAAPLLSCGGAIGPLYNSPCVRDGIFGSTTRSCWVLHGPALGAQQIATVAFYLAFFFWHRIAPEQLCFFDLLTQAQHGPDRAKTQAMQQVFLRHSRRLCVLWSPGYFERLSTVFALAAFVHFDGSSWERGDFLGVATNLVVPVGQALSALAARVGYRAGAWEIEWFGRIYARCAAAGEAEPGARLGGLAASGSSMFSSASSAEATLNKATWLALAIFLGLAVILSAGWLK